MNKSSQSVEDNTKSRPASWIVRRALILVGAAFGGIAFVGIDAILTNRGIERERDRIRALGRPATGAELNDVYHNDRESDRLGREFAQMYDLYDTTHEYEGETAYWARKAKTGETPTTEAVEHMRRHLLANELYMSRLRALVRTPHEVRFLMDLSRGFQTEFPHLADTRNGLRMFSIQAQVAAADGDIVAAVNSLLEGVLLSETLRSDPLLIPQLVRFACHTINIDSIEFLVNAVLMPAEHAALIQKSLDDVEIDGSVQTGLVGEWVLHSSVDLVEEYLTTILSAQIGNHVPLIGNYIGPKWQLNLLQEFPRVESIGYLPSWERAAASRLLLESVDRRWSAFHLLTKIAVPPLPRAYEAEVRMMAELDTTRVGLAVLRFAMEREGLPDHLDELLPVYLDAVPLDPFDGKDLRYKQTEAGFTVYSIAHNLVDDGGVPPAEGKRILNEGDIVFRVLDASPYLQQMGAS